jgi:mono/diheme cytochrome c family protein
MKLGAYAAGCILLCLLVLAVVASSPAAPAASNLARGKYIVQELARCGDCHTPHDEKGEPVAGKILRGAALTFKPVMPQPVWADKAPNIAGLRGWEDDSTIKFFRTGIAYNDLPPRPPMPQYHMNQQDAEAVVAYLKSLSPVEK